MPVRSTESSTLWGSFRNTGTITYPAPRQATMTDALPIAEPSAPGPGWYQWTVASSDLPVPQNAGTMPPYSLTASAAITFQVATATVLNFRRYVNGTAIETAQNTSVNATGTSFITYELGANFPTIPGGEGLKVGDVYAIHLWMNNTGTTVYFVGNYFVPTRFRFGAGMGPAYVPAAGAMSLSIGGPPGYTLGVSPTVFVNQSMSGYVGNQTNFFSMSSGNFYDFPIVCGSPQYGVARADHGDTSTFIQATPSGASYPYYRKPVVPILIKWRPLEIGGVPTQF